MIKYLLQRPIAVSVIIVSITILGIVAMRLLPVSLVPNIKIPQITIQVSAIDMSARELDEAVVKPLRSQLIQMNNIASMRTETKDGVGNIYLSFNFGTDIDYSFIEVNEKIDKASNFLPPNVERPKVMKASATDIPAFYLNVTLKNEKSSTQKDELYPVSGEFSALSAFVRQVIVKRIEQLDDVAMVDVSGLTTNELLIIPDQEKLKQLDVDYEVINKALKQQNLNLGNLMIRDGEYHFNVRFDSKITSKRDIEETFLKINERVFQIKDLAAVYDHPRKLTGMVISDGKYAVSMAIIKQSEAQMSVFKEKLDQLIETFNNEYSNIDFTVTRDQTQLLEYSIDNLISNVVVGGVLACLVLFFFMKDFRTPFLITLSIPISIIVSLLAFYVLGITINIVSLSGFVLGIGMMVDNSIIVIDNITQRWERGEPLIEATSKGASEMFVAMLSSVLTTCSVFVPLIFLSDISGALFYDQAMSIVISLFASLGVAMTVIPVYYYLLYRKSDHYKPNKFIDRFNVINYHTLYERCLKWHMRNQWFVVVSIVVAIVASVWLFIALPKSSLPPLTQTDMLVNIDWNDRITLQENERRMEELYALTKEKSIQTTNLIGDNQYLLSHTKNGGIQESITYIACADAGSLLQVKELLSTQIKNRYPDAIFSFNASGNIFDLIFSSNEAPIIAKLRTTNGKAPEPLELNAIIGKLSTAIPGQNLEPAAYNQQVEFSTLNEKMTLYGVTHPQIITALKNALGANNIFTIVQGQSSIPVVISNNRNELNQLVNQTNITLSDGEQVSLSTFLIETRSQDLKTIISGAEGDYYPIAFHVNDFEAPELMDKVKQIVRDQSDFEVDFVGSFFSNRKMIGELSIILLVSISLLFLILAAQFESLVLPLIILSEIVIDLFGAFFVLWLFGSSINLMSMIGIIVMSGIVINDSIIKIDTITKLQREGYSIIRAIMVGGYRRLTPIIMTSLTTILAICPFLVTGDLGSDLQYPLSLALIGGMVVGTLVSVFFIPIIYYWIYRKKA